MEPTTPLPISSYPINLFFSRPVRQDERQMFNELLSSSDDREHRQSSGSRFGFKGAADKLGQNIALKLSDFSAVAPLWADNRSARALGLAWCMMWDSALTPRRSAQSTGDKALTTRRRFVRTLHNEDCSLFGPTPRRDIQQCHGTRRTPRLRCRRPRRIRDLDSGRKINVKALYVLEKDSARNAQD